jgi:hypothetical protein
MDDARLQHSLQGTLLDPPQVLNSMTDTSMCLEDLFNTKNISYMFFFFITFKHCLSLNLALT